MLGQALFRNGRLLCRSQTGNDLRVSEAKSPASDTVSNRFRQIQQSQMICDSCPLIADNVCQRLLGQLTLLHQCVIAFSAINGIEVLAMNIFDQGKPRLGVNIESADDRRDFGQSRQFRSP